METIVWVLWDFSTVYTYLDIFVKGEVGEDVFKVSRANI